MPEIYILISFEKHIKRCYKTNKQIAISADRFAGATSAWYTALHVLGKLGQKSTDRNIPNIYGSDVGRTGQLMETIQNIAVDGNVPRQEI